MIVIQYPCRAEGWLDRCGKYLPSSYSASLYEYLRANWLLFLTLHYMIGELFGAVCVSVQSVTCMQVSIKGHIVWLAINK